jgi:hypothetical protein
MWLWAGLSEGRSPMMGDLGHSNPGGEMMTGSSSWSGWGSQWGVNNDPVWSVFRHDCRGPFFPSSLSFRSEWPCAILVLGTLGWAGEALGLQRHPGFTAGCRALHLQASFAWLSRATLKSFSDLTLASPPSVLPSLPWFSADWRLSQDGEPQPSSPTSYQRRGTMRPPVAVQRLTHSNCLCSCLV